MCKGRLRLKVSYNTRQSRPSPPLCRQDTSTAAAFQGKRLLPFYHRGPGHDELASISKKCVIDAKRAILSHRSSACERDHPPSVCQGLVLVCNDSPVLCILQASPVPSLQGEAAVLAEPAHCGGPPCGGSGGRNLLCGPHRNCALHTQETCCAGVARH